MDYLDRCEIKREIDSAEEDGDPLSAANYAPSIRLTIPRLKVQNFKYIMGVPQEEELGRCQISLGQTFGSFPEVSEAVREYERENGVQLTAKYFRRIAANPKPSNKEDFMLTVEERKRFVYRWVDFCCTFYDGRIGNPEQGDTVPVPGPAVGFSAKECPMRIRFQLRTKEKDLIISTCMETHDHADPTCPRPPTNSCAMPSLPSQVQVLPTAKLKLVKESESIVNNQAKPKARRPIPPLNALPSVNSHIRESSPRTVATSRSSASTTKMGQHWLPKPPPLRRGAVATISTLASASTGSISDTNEMSSSQPSPVASPTPILSGLSARTVITNLYNYLLQTRNEGPEPNGMGFLSANPNLIKITAKMSGMDEKFVFQIIHGKRFRTPTTSIANTGTQIPTHVKNSFATRKRSIGMACRPPLQQELRRNLHTIAKMRKATQVRYQQQKNASTTNRSSSHSRDHSEVAFNLPLEVIIKSEPNGDDYEGNGTDFEDSSFGFNAACSTR